MTGPSVPLREYFDERHQEVMRTLERIESHQGQTNGRVSQAETQITRLQERVDAHRAFGASGLLSGLGLAGWAIWERLTRQGP